MHVRSLSISRPTQYHRTLVLALIGLLLWAMWAFTVHHHHDEALGADTECQICQFGAHGSAAIPVTGFLSISVLPETVSDTSIENTLIALHIRANDARAPPFIS